MKKSYYALAVGFVTAAGVALGSTAASASNPAISVEELVPVLSNPQKASDTLPEYIIPADHGGFDTKTVRLLGSDDVATYWVATTKTDVCLIQALSGPDEVVGSACSMVGDFADHGTGMLTVAGPEQPSIAESYLLPADIDAAAVGLISTEERSARLATGANFHAFPGGMDKDLEVRTVERDEGSSFEFSPIVKQEPIR